MEDCTRIIIEDAGIELSEEDIQFAFVESKMMISNELDEDLNKRYKQMVFVEFCEFLAHVVIIQF